MGDISDWIQSYWFELGSLLLQFATLTALVWFARRMLGIVLSSQGHAEALHPGTAPPTEPVAEAQPYHGVPRGLIPVDPPPSQPRAWAANVGSRDGDLWHSIGKWMNTPMGNAPVAWRRYQIRRVY